MLGRVEGQDHEHLNYIVIPQSTVGRRHALIEYKDFGYWIADQGSINGTFVNDKAISTEVRLKHGDRVRLHKFEFEFVMPEMSDAGMTVVSNTVFAAGEAADAESTLLKGDVAAGTPVPEPDFDIGIGDSPEHTEASEEDTVIRGNGQSTPREEYSSEDETLLPGSQAPASSGAGAAPADDETLMPGHAPGRESEPEFSTDDETLMPSAPEPGKASRSPKGGADEGDFFDITGAATDDDRK
jgi:pSer/pThr/pTyr-binding forkhead associated (FHA) protein